MIMRYPKVILYSMIILLAASACSILGYSIEKDDEPIKTAIPAVVETPTVNEAPIAQTTSPMEAPIETPIAIETGLDIGSTMVSEIDGMTLVYVPAGEFTMGDTADHALAECQKYRNNCEKSWFTYEEPPHQVYLDAYWIDQTEVTNAMYQKCVNDNVCTNPSRTYSDKHDAYFGDSQYANYPVINVNWQQATDYCTWAGRQLPSEAQWEKAARGPNGNIYPWGNTNPDETLANYAQKIGETTMVGSYPEGASPYRALDMAGNVWEWVSDWYGSYPIGYVINPNGPNSGDSRIVRGGSLNNLEDDLSSAYRLWANPTNTYDYLGFRCSLSISESP